MKLNDSNISQLDALDIEILRIVSKDGRLPVTEIAKRVGASKTPCQVRLKKLIKNGYIKGFRAVLDPKRLGQDHIAFSQVKLSDTREEALTAFNQAVQGILEVEQCHLIAASFDYLLKIRTSNLEEYRRILGEEISKLPYVMNTSTFIAIETVKDNAV